MSLIFADVARPAQNRNFWQYPARQAYDTCVVPNPTSILPVLRKTVGCLMQAIARRVEERVPRAVRVDLCSLDVRHRAHEALTENVSAHGARVVSSNPWKLNDRLNLWSLPGDFRARARVVYCEPLGDNSFAIGLQLLASTGEWK
jgi:hypothetical protein